MERARLAPVRRSAWCRGRQRSRTTRCPGVSGLPANCGPLASTRPGHRAAQGGRRNERPFHPAPPSPALCSMGYRPGVPRRRGRLRGRDQPSDLARNDRYASTWMDTGDVDVTARGDVDKLKGNAVGLYSILFLCVTGSAPLAVFIYNTPFTMPYGSGSGGPGDLPLRDDRAHDLLDRIRRDGQEGARRRRHVHLRQPRPRAGLGRDGRLLADDRLHDLRRRPDRRLLLVPAGQARCSTATTSTGCGSR